MISPSNTSTIYVSQDSGSDGNTGFYPQTTQTGGPLKTLKRAIELVCWLRSSGHFQPITIKIMDERFFLSEPVVISDIAGNYGGEASNITIEPYSKTLVCGAKAVTGFVKDILNGTACFSAEVPEVREGIWYSDLYVDGVRAKYTRFPQRGTLEPEETENNSTALNAHSSWFKARPEDFETISGFENINDCIVSFNHYWVDEHTKIAGIDEKSRKINLLEKTAYSVSPEYPASAMHYYIENVREEFKNPGEWYLDRKTAKLYYIPISPNQTPENITAYLPVTGTFFKIRGSSEKPIKNIYLKDLEIAYGCGFAKWTNIAGEAVASPGQSTNSGSAAVVMEYAHNCTVDGCTIHGTGIHAIRLDKGCHNVIIENNSIYDCGAGGVVIAGGGDKNKEAELSANNIVFNNKIHSLGRRYAASCGILVCNGNSNILSHNEIYDLYYTGISAGWVWGYGDSVSDNNIIEYNHIYNVGQGILSDMGGIYLLGKQKGTLVYKNLIHDVSAKHYGGWGIYTDEGSSFIRIEGNVCYNISHNCFHQHFGAENTVVNNLFARSGEHLIKFSHSEMHTGAIIERNILISRGIGIYNFSEWVDGGSKDNCSHTYVVGAHNNILFDEETHNPLVLCVNDEKYDLAGAQETFGLECGSCVADPGISEIVESGFTIVNNPLIRKIGFKPINLEKAGIIEN